MDNYEKIKKMCSKQNIAKGKQSKEYLFTINCTDMFYYKYNIGEVDIVNGFTDGANDGGIDFIYSDNDTLYLIQGKSSESISTEDIKNLFSKMVDTINDFEDKQYDKYSALLKQTYLNAYDDLTDEKNIELVLFTNTALSKDQRDEINSLAASDRYNSYGLSVYDINNIKEQEALLFQNSDLIEEDKIYLDTNEHGSKNILKYGDNGIIVNIKASSLKKLFEKYGANGLFSYNLREHISQKSVDDEIDNTIKNEKENFWSYNNGITIGCKDFNENGNNIKLYDFSIINGAQTTTKIGKSKFVDEKHDFAIVCKIVRSNEIDDPNSFISKISQASNSQKPIKQRDLKSNFIEQKLLQTGAAKNGKNSLAIEIKRGVRPRNYKKVENSWQRITNEYMGQLIYACLLQKPGPARNSKNTMFSTKKTYKEIFQRKHDFNTLYDLVNLGHCYDDFAAQYISKNTDLDKIAIVKNGKLPILAVSTYLCKKTRGIVSKSTASEVKKDNLTGFLISNYQGDDLYNLLNNLFSFIVKRLDFVYKTNKDIMKITSYSNFFKSEQIYEIILREFDELDDYDKDKLNEFCKIFKI